MRNYLVFIISIITLVSCDSKQVFDEYKTVENKWDKNDVISFDFKAPDTINNYDLFVNLRNNNQYEFSNIFLIVTLKTPNANQVTDTLEYKMTNNKGEWLGTGFSEIKENKLWLKEQFKFKESGNYNIGITHAVRKNGSINGVEYLKGITDVGFRIEKQTNKKKAL